LTLTALVPTILMSALGGIGQTTPEIDPAWTTATEATCPMDDTVRPAATFLGARFFD
jgi:hypothetical protein